jgi:hypothetical protein
VAVIDRIVKTAEDEADEAEVRAQRVASVSFLRTFEHELGDGNVEALARSEHEHHCLVRLGNGKALFVRMRLTFGELLNEQQIAELIAASAAVPGGVTRA